MLGRGGYPQAENPDFETLNQLLEEPFQTLEDLAKRIADGIYSEAQIAAWTRSTIDGSAAGYEVENSRAYGIPFNILPAHPCDGSTPCSGSCHCHWAHHIENGYYVGSTWTHPPLHRRIPGVEPCDVCYERIHSWNPWRPPGGRIKLTVKDPINRRGRRTSILSDLVDESIASF